MVIGHVERKTGENMDVSGHRTIRRPNRKWSDVVRKDMKAKGVQREEAQYRITRITKTRCADPKIEKRPRRIYSVVLLTTCQIPTSRIRNPYSSTFILVAMRPHSLSLTHLAPLLGY